MLSAVTGAGMLKRHQHNALVRKHGTITQCCFNDGSRLKQHWMNARVCAKVYDRPGDRLVLGQRRRRLTGIEPAMSCNAGPTFSVEVHHRQVWNEWWPAPAIVVEGIHVEDIFELVSLVLSSIISWTFRILAHEEDQYTDFFVKRTQMD